MRKKISMDDIAETLNLSRNTVSKAFNNQPLPEKTRQLILNKAIELGYKNLDTVAKRETILHHKNILILTTNDLQNLNFFLSVLRGIDNIVTKYNLNLLQFQYGKIHQFQDLKDYIRISEVSGILCLETFDTVLVKQLLSLKIPVVFMDSTIDCIEYSGNFDIILMENRNSMKNLIKTVIRASSITKIGFIGDYLHCLGFYERFVGFREALFDHKLHYQSKYSIMKADEFPYGDQELLASELRQMDELPELFVCANDFLAISLIKALKVIGKRVPHDVQVIGFDNTLDARNFEIPLTTIDTDKEVLGNESIVTLLNRIKYKEERNRIIHLKTKPIYRESTL
ncbi:MAG: LacI family DNA-binding transcriptional regulator [Acholeplasmataceae bacterium]|jgi:LacI family transcriptional regulator|nr:LacI family DNA-binding transcriptional regulator [Acholeplasmataceae bacterium]